MINLNVLSHTFTFYSGPAHGWLAVPNYLLKELRVSPSSYSYYDHKTDLVYLEEDCDAGQFDQAFEKRLGRKPLVKRRHIDDESFIRKLTRT